MATKKKKEPSICMLAAPYNPKKIKWVLNCGCCPCNVYVEDKIDGIRFIFKDGKAYTRNGNVYETLTPFAKIIDKAWKKLYPLAGYHVDCEAIGRNWNETSKLLKRTKNIDIKAIAKYIKINILDV